MSDIPYFTQHEIRALLYIREANQELGEDAPGKIAELSDITDWDSKYYTRAHQRLDDKLIDVVKDGKYTRLRLTDAGKKVADKLMDVNQVLAQ